MAFTVTFYGYQTFLPGQWDVGIFFSYYTMSFVCPILYVGWKLLKGTKIVKAEEADLVWELPEIEAYERSVEGTYTGFYEDVRGMFGKRKVL